MRSGVSPKRCAKDLPNLAPVNSREQPAPSRCRARRLRGAASRPDEKGIGDERAEHRAGDKGQADNRRARQPEQPGRDAGWPVPVRPILNNGAEEAPMAAPSNRARNGAPHCPSGARQQRSNSPSSTCPPCMHHGERLCGACCERWQGQARQVANSILSGFVRVPRRLPRTP